MNRRSILSLIAASTGLLCGARRPDIEPRLQIGQASWHRGPEYDEHFNPTGNQKVTASFVCSAKAPFPLENGSMLPGDWLDSPLARAIRDEACLPRLRPGKRRSGMRIDVPDSNVLEGTKMVYVTYTEIPA